VKHIAVGAIVGVGVMLAAWLLWFLWLCIEQAPVLGLGLVAGIAIAVVVAIIDWKTEKRT
jgi:hypothetical protein